ncbi:MAG: mechanosensitive ion channel family protein [Deltaproteobacteria bacterium]|nr:mechanosensitive ion channel family protein [Deltaproteobacteria bacterium]
MSDLLTSFFALFSAKALLSFFSVVFLLSIGIPLSFYFGNTTHRFVSRRFSPQQGMIAAKVVQYGLIALVVIAVLHQLGFSLTPLLGAAGIVGIAVGFASQTSISNVISGIFLLAEEAFKVGDTITIENVTGIVLSVDILSVKIRTFDNRYIRIPNETVIKSPVINITKFPIRRIDIKIPISYRADLKRVREVLLSLAKNNPYCLQEPEPLVIFKEFSASSIDLLFAIWTHGDHYLALNNSIKEEIRERFDQEGIEIPFSPISLYAGSDPKPIPVNAGSSVA